MKHCYKYWIDRNKAYHNETVQKERIMNWYQKVKEEMINCECPQVKSFTRRNELDETHTSPHVMQQWMHNVNEMHRKAEKRPKNDIRRYFEC